MQQCDGDCVLDYRRLMCRNDCICTPVPTVAAGKAVENKPVRARRCRSARHGHDIVVCCSGAAACLPRTHVARRRAASIVRR
jgi:hypothetical protein